MTGLMDQYISNIENEFQFFETILKPKIDSVFYKTITSNKKSRFFIQIKIDDKCFESFSSFEEKLIIAKNKAANHIIKFLLNNNFFSQKVYNLTAYVTIYT